MSRRNLRCSAGFQPASSRQDGGAGNPESGSDRPCTVMSANRKLVLAEQSNRTDSRIRNNWYLTVAPPERRLEEITAAFSPIVCLGFRGINPAIRTDGGPSLPQFNNARSKDRRRKSSLPEVTALESIPHFSIALPNILQSLRQGLLFHGAVSVPGVTGKNKLVMIAPGSERFRHVFIGGDPIVHIVAHDIRIEKVSVANFHPDSQRLRRTLGDQVFMKFPCAVRGLGVIRPLLIDIGTRIGENAVVELRVMPGHDQSAGATGTAAHRRPALGIPGEFHVAFCLHERQHFSLDELRIPARHGVVFQAAFAALRVPPAIAERNGDHHRYTVLGDQIIQGGEQPAVGSVRADDEGCDFACDILFGDVNRHSASVRSDVARSLSEIDFGSPQIKSQDFGEEGGVDY